MDLLYIENYLIFSAFLTLFLLEVGIAVGSLALGRNYVGRLRRYLLSIWAINGTFAVFYLVNTEATYPKLLEVIGTVYAIPILVGALFFIVRNAFLIYSEFASKGSVSRNYSRLYSLSVIVIAFIAIATLGSTVSGDGIDLVNGSVDELVLIINPFNIMLFAAALLLSICFVSLYFDIKSIKGIGIDLGIVSLLLVLVGIYLFVPALWSALVSNLYLLAAALAIFIACALASLTRLRYSRYVAFVGIMLLVNLFGVLEYPYLFGGSISLLSFLPSSAEGAALLAITTTGGIFLLLSLGYLFSLAHRR